MSVRIRLVVAAVLALLPVAGGVAMAETPCTPVARLSGEPALVEAVESLLRARGVAIRGDGVCGEIVAVLAADQARIRVAITDADGRQVERVAKDAAGAATAIESWARQDVGDPLLATRSAPAVVAARDVAESPPPPTEGAVTGATAAAPKTRRIALVAAADVELGDDGSVWRGGGVHGCVQLRRLCIGALIHYAADTERLGESAQRGNSRSALDLLLAVERPIDLGRLTIAPGAAVGQSTLRADRDYLGADRQDEHDQATSLHLRARVSASYRISGDWSLRLELAGGWSPSAPPLLGELDGELLDEAPLAGAPRWRGAVGVGLAYGGL